MGYSITLAAATGATAPSQANIASATELSIQVWLKAGKLRANVSSPTTVLCWFATAIPSGTLKMGIVLGGNTSVLVISIYTPGLTDYQTVVDGSGNPIDISSLVDSDDVVLYVGHALTTGAFQLEAGVYRENGTLVGAIEPGKNFNATSLGTTAASGALWWNYETGGVFSHAETIGTFKRIAIWNKAIASANRTIVPVGSESGLLSLWGNANGFTVGSGTTEPNQVSGGSTLTLDASVVWNNLGGGGGGATAAVFRSFRMHRGRK